MVGLVGKLMLLGVDSGLRCVPYLPNVPNLPNLSLIDLQRKLLGDSVRNDAFAEAMKKVIKKGETIVIDLGSGTGFLSFLASRLGAKHVTLIESGEICKTSKALAKRNGINNCTFLCKHSTRVHGLPKADVLLSETLGNYALEENILESIEDGKRFLKPNGIVIPAKISQFVCPVVTDRLQKEIDVWPHVGFDLDFTEAREIAMNNIYVKTVKKEDLLALPDSIRQWDSIDFSRSHQRGAPPRDTNSSMRKANVVWTFEKPTTVHGFALWWNAELVKGVELSTSPMKPATHWEQIYLPLLKSVSVPKGSSIELRLTSDTRWKTKINLTWTLRLLDEKGKQISMQELDMRKGLIG